MRIKYHDRLTWGVTALLCLALAALIGAVYSSASSVSRLRREAAAVSAIDDLSSELQVVGQTVTEWAAFAVGAGPKPDTGNAELLDSGDRFIATAERLMEIDPESGADELTVRFRSLWIDVMSLQSVGRPTVDLVLNSQIAPEERSFRSSLIALQRAEAEELDAALGETRSSQLVLRVVAPIALGLAVVLALFLVKLVSSSRRVEELERLSEVKDQFLASVSHEIRTPLTVVVGLAHELRDRLDSFSVVEIEELSSLLAGQADEVKAIVEDLLVAARDEAGQLRVAVKELSLAEELAKLGDCCEGLDGLATVIPVDRRVVVDPGRFRQIMRNLLSNAVRYGGDQIRVSVEDHGGMIGVVVADNGPGVRADERDRVFDPYYVSSQQGGVPGSIGLGLHVARRLARLMGGDLTHRREDGWTLFDVWVPAVPAIEGDNGHASRHAADEHAQVSTG